MTLIFAQSVTNDSVSIALVGIVGTVIVSLFKLLGENTRALKKVAESSERVALATTKSAKEAKQRNGHLGEQNVQIAKLVTTQNTDVTAIKQSNDKIASILSKSALIAAEDRDALLSPEQHIETQIVEHQEIKGAK